MRLNYNDMLLLAIWEYDRLVNNGKLKENVREIGCCNIIMAISNTNAI